MAPAHSNWDAAEAQAKAAVSLCPGRADAYAILADIYAGRAQWGELDAILAAAQKEAPDDLVAFYRAATRLVATGQDPARAQRYLRTYQTQEPDGNEPSVAAARAVYLSAVSPRPSSIGTR